MKKKVTGIFFLGAFLFSLCSLSACHLGTAKIRTSKDGAKTVVTALYYTPLPEFELLVEAAYDDIDLQIEQGSVSTYNSDALRRLKNGHGKDLVFSSMPSGEVSNYLLDLSANSFTTDFASAVMEPVQRDGKTVWLPMPCVYKSLIINKTLAGELGMKLPESQQELKEFFAAAKAKGVGVDKDGFVFAAADMDNMSVSELIVSAMTPDFLGTMDGERWTNDFIEKKANAEGTLEEPLSFFISLAKEGYMDPSRIYLDIQQKNAMSVTQRMAERKLAACYGYSSVLHSIRAANVKDEFVMIPFLSGKGNEPWVAASPAAYLGVNSDAAEDEKKLDAILRVLELFASQKGQAAILKDTESDASYLTEQVESACVSNSGLDRYVSSGHVYHLNRFDSNILRLLGTNVIKACMGDMELSEALKSVDQMNKNGAESYSEDYTLIGSVENDLLYEAYNTRKRETALGNLAADSVAELADVDIAFVNGGAIRSSLYAGDVYVSDLAAVCPFEDTIVVLDVTGETLYQMLEHSIAGIYYQDVPKGRFLQVSGIKYKVTVDKSKEDISDKENPKPALAVLQEASLKDGSPIEKDKIYRIAVNSYLCGRDGYSDGGDGYAMLNVFDDTLEKAADADMVKDTKKTYADALVAYFRNHSEETISPALEGRIIIQEASQ